jgi:hypothetical protein
MNYFSMLSGCNQQVWTVDVEMSSIAEVIRQSIQLQPQVTQTSVGLRHESGKCANISVFLQSER